MSFHPIPFDKLGIPTDNFLLAIFFRRRFANKAADRSRKLAARDPCTSEAPVVSTAFHTTAKDISLNA